jgi:dTDP-4-amino-4,6-dideoxygalactose transaminase
LEEQMGVSYDEFARALTAEGIPAGASNRPLYKFPIFAEERTYGQSRYPFVDERGNRRIDYASMHLPVVERELPRTGCLMSRSTDTEEDARDIGTAIRKVALHYAARK